MLTLHGVGHFCLMKEKPRLSSTISDLTTVLHGFVFCALISIMTLSVGADPWTCLSLTAGLAAQMSLGHLVISKLGFGDPPLMYRAVLALGTGSLTVSLLAMWISMIPVLRGALLVWLIRSALAGALVLVLWTVWANRLQLYDLVCAQRDERKSFVGALVVSGVILAEVDWRLVFLPIILAVVNLAFARVSMSSSLLSSWSRDTGTVVAAVMGFSGAMAFLGINRVPREFASLSDDFNQWLMMSWSGISFGPLDDPLKAGTGFGYHLLSNYWVGITSAVGGLDHVVVQAFSGYLFFGSSAAVAVNSLMASTIPGRSGGFLGWFGTAVALLWVPSALELRVGLPVESFTQFVSFGWLLILLPLILSADENGSSAGRVVLGVAVGSLLLAKATTASLAFVIIAGKVVYQIYCGRGAAARRLGVLLVTSVSTAMLAYFAVYWPARNESYFGHVKLEWNVLDRWPPYVLGFQLGEGFRLFAMYWVWALSVVLPVFASLVVLSRWTRQSTWVIPVYLGGLSQIVVGCFSYFAPQGAGESYLLGSGLTLLTAVVAAWTVQALSDFSTVGTGGVFVVAGLAGLSSGVGLWGLRIDGSSMIAERLVLGALVLAILGVVGFIGGHRRWSSLGSSKRKAMAVSLAVSLLALGSGHYLASVIRKPAMTAVAALDGRVTWDDFASEIRDQLVLLTDVADGNRIASCIRENSIASDVIAVLGRNSTRIAAESKRRLYVDERFISYIQNHMTLEVRNLLYQRMSDVRDVAAGTVTSEIISRMAADRVSLVVVQEDVVRAENFLGGGRSSAVCDFQSGFVVAVS